MLVQKLLEAVCTKSDKDLACYRHVGAKVERRYSSYSFLTSARYSSYSFLTPALDEVSSYRHIPAALYPREKDPRYRLDRRLDGPQSWSEYRGQRKIRVPVSGIESR
jgi:hypothetical protein